MRRSSCTGFRLCRTTSGETAKDSKYRDLADQLN